MVSVIVLERHYAVGKLKGFDKVVPVDDTYEQVASLSNPQLHRAAILLALMLLFVVLELAAVRGAVWVATVLAILAAFPITTIESRLRDREVRVYELDEPQLVWSMRMQIASVIVNALGILLMSAFQFHFGIGWISGLSMSIVVFGVPMLIAIWRVMIARPRIW